MHIVYAVTACSNNVYTRLFSDVKVKPAFQSQKYHRLLIEGLAAGAAVDVIANPPVNRSVMDEKIIFLPEELAAGAQYHHLPAIRNPLIKLVAMAVGTFFKTLHYTKKDSVVLVDVLNRTTALSAQMAARMKRCRCVGIIIDLPDMLGGSRLSVGMANYVIKHCTDYVILTQAMNEYIRNTDKPYGVLEGHADITMVQKKPSMERKAKPRICFYAGGVSKQYGLQMLVEGFRKADIPNTQLHIYGPGDYVQELEQISKEDTRVYYGGMLMNSEIIEKEMDATLLINPRPTNEAYVKYSFPSKNMEYMASGTPVLTTALPGMPEEYYPHVFVIQEETPEGMAEALKMALSHSEEELFQKGLSAREFVLKERSNVVQAKKILEMLKQ